MSIESTLRFSYHFPRQAFGTKCNRFLAKKVLFLPRYSIRRSFRLLAKNSSVSFFSRNDCECHFGATGFPESCAKPSPGRPTAVSSLSNLGLKHGTVASRLHRRLQNKPDQNRAIVAYNSGRPIPYKAKFFVLSPTKDQFSKKTNVQCLVPTNPENDFSVFTSGPYSWDCSFPTNQWTGGNV